MTRVAVLGFVTALEVLTRKRNFCRIDVRAGVLVWAYARM